jgi:hypothetical protein
MNGPGCAMKLGQTFNSARARSASPYGRSNAMTIWLMRYSCALGMKTYMPGNIAERLIPLTRPNGGDERNWNTTTGELVRGAWNDSSEHCRVVWQIERLST